MSRTMSRTIRALTTACLGIFLVAAIGCEDKDSKEALNSCKNELGNEQKKEAANLATIADLKSKLSVAQTKIDDMTKATAAAKEVPGKGAKVADSKESKTTAMADKKSAKK